MWKNFIPNSTDDETVNNAFCTNSLFRITSESEVTVYPQIQAQIQNKRMLLCVDNSLILLQDENIMECNLLSFGAKIEALAVSQSGNVIVCALSDGNIHGIFIKGIPLFNLSVKEEDLGSDGTFVGIKQFEDSFYIVCRNGKVYRLFNIDEKLVETYSEETVCENESHLYNDTIIKNTVLERLTTPKFPSTVTSFCCIPAEELLCESSEIIHSFIMTDGYFIYFQESQTYFRLGIPESFAGIKALFNMDHMIIGLSNNGQIFEICPYTKTIFELFGEQINHLIEEFIILENNEDDIELLLLTKLNHLENRSMKIIEFPSLNCKSELSMPKHSWLVQQQKSAVNMYYIAGNDFNELDLPQEIEMKLISETRPEERLKKLVYKGRLDEAEEFGKQFNLNLQPICEAKVKRKLLEMSSLNENQQDLIEEKFEELLVIFKTIENNDFFLTISSFEIPSRNVMEKFLQLILTRLSDQRYLQNIFDIKEQLLRLETLNIIDPYETNMQWQKFVHHPNIVKVCVGLFKTDMISSCLIWKRHAACVIPLLDVHSILKILNSIPQATEAFYVVQWLRYFIPSTLQIHPSAMTSLVEWCIHKTRSLQYSAHWPEVGLEFSTNLLNIFEEVDFLYCDFRRQYDSNIAKLKAIVNALQDLSVLKKSYNFTLTLDNYVKDALDDSALRILQGVQLSNLKKVACDFLYPIYLERGKTPINAIKMYISYLVRHKKNISFWLERAVVAISLLHNEEEKLENALLVLKNSPVPWPDATTPLVKLSNSSHPLAAEIRGQYDIQIIKILKGKYGWPFDSSDNNMKLVFRIVKVGLPEMISDINELVKVCPEISGSANFYCCYELARSGQTQKAVQFLRSLKEKQRSECYEKLTNILTAMFSNATEDVINSEHLFEFLKVVTLDCDESKSEILIDLQRLHSLRKNYGLQISIVDLKNTSKRMEMLLQGIDSIQTRLQEKKRYVTHYIWNQITYLAKLLHFEKIFGVLHFAKKINKLDLSCALAYYLLNLETVSQANYDFYIDLSALLVCQHIEAVAKDINCTNFKSDPLVYPLVYRLLVEALKIGKVFQLEIIEFLKWVSIGNEMYSLTAVEEFYGEIENVEQKVSDIVTGYKDSPKHNEVHSTERRESISVFDNICKAPEAIKVSNDPTSVIKCLSMALLAIILELNFQDVPFRLNLFINPNIAELTEDVKITLLSLLDHLVKSKQYSSWYTIVQYTTKYRNCGSLIPKKVIVSHKLKMFKYLLAQKEPNFVDLFSMLLSEVNSEGCLKYLESELKTGQSKLNYLTLAEMYHTHVGDDEKIATDREQRMKYYYYTELIKQDAALKSKPSIEFISISMLMKELKNKVLDVALLKKLSSDFDWDYQRVLVAQIITLLSMQEPSYEIKTDAMGKEEIVMKVSEVQLREMCQPYIKEITNTGILASKLHYFIPEINFYFYELYLCVIDILTYINALPKEMELWANILLFLKHKMVTKRRHRAGQMEMDWWLKSQSEVGVLPKIAKYRFPFKPLVQEPLKNILDDEVNVDNCESWFALIKLHTVNQGRTNQSEIIQEQEYFCMSAVKNSISEYKQQNEDSDADVWHLQPINNAFLQSILRLIRNMTNLSKILFILYFVTNHAREGADQVEAAAECYKFAVLNEKHLISNKKAEETVIKIKRKYPLIKTQHLLHIYGLIEEEILQLAENPKNLTNALYHHSSILTTPKSDINSLVSEISDLHGLDFHSIQVSLVQTWLSNSNSSGSVDVEETFYEDLNVSMSNVNTLNNEHIIRAYYILNSWKRSEAVEFLIALLFPVDKSIDTTLQLQIFECFSKLVDDTSAPYLTAVNQDQYIILKCIHFLKQLGYNITVEKFSEYNKLSILKKLWQSHANNILGLEAVSYICIGYDIFIPTIWNGVLKQMVNLNMVSRLNALVDMLSCKTSLLYTQGLICAWECVLRDPFKNASHLRSHDQEVLLAKNLFRIQACPLVKQLNVLVFVEDCLRLDRPHMAAVFITLATKKQRENIIPIIMQHKKDTLKDDIIELEEMGISPTIVNFAIQQLNL